MGLLCFVLAVLASPFKSKLRLQAENTVLRHQLIVLRRRLHGRVRLTTRQILRSWRTVRSAFPRDLCRELEQPPRVYSRRLGAHLREKSDKPRVKRLRHRVDLG
jgi:hypothetical protein